MFGLAGNERRYIICQSFQSKLEKNPIQPGRSVYVHCSVKGEPVPALKWMLPGGGHVKPSQFLGRRLFVFPNGTLYVKNIIPADTGR